MSAKGASSHSDAELIEQIKQKILNDHNKYRKQHHVPPLKLHNTLSRIAEDWSLQLLTAGILKHRPASKFGENLWTGSGFTINDMLTNEKANPVSSWYAEINVYPDAPFEKWGHFTQLVWKDTKYLGCGISYEDDEQLVFVVCNYDPPGNWNNRYRQNVFTAEGAPWGRPSEDDFALSTGASKKDDDDASDGGPDSIGFEDIEETPTPYWMYGLGISIILLVVIFLAILIYYQKS